MPHANVNGTELYYEETGEGFPLVWSHEFAGDYRSWEPQVRYFARRYRVITYNNRGYPPSAVPGDPAAYSNEILVEDLYHLLRHLGIGQAHVGGLSMGGNVALNFGLTHPHMCKSLIVAGCGSGTVEREQFLTEYGKVADRLDTEGIEVLAERFSTMPARRGFREKDHEAAHPARWPPDAAHARPHDEHRGSRLVQPPHQRIPDRGRERPLGDLEARFLTTP